MAMDPHGPNGVNSRKKALPVLGAKPAAAPAPTVGFEGEELIDVDAALREYEQAERERLGIRKERKQWVDTMLTPQVRKHERDAITIYLGGLTAAQDFLVEGALRGLGYKVEHLDVPDQAGLQVGKEYGNRGQCNPTYFTVGNLVKKLIELRDEKGLTSEEVVKNYVFLTAGACGPCRFGMYVTEYRKALRDAGFDGFRVMLFQQTGGLSQATGADVGIEMNADFFIGIVKAIVAGDVLNALGYRIRPYEVVPGSTNEALEAAKKIVYEALFAKTNVLVALYKARKVLEKVPVDRLRPRAKVSIIGEFWAMTTEGDGNYHLQKFLESEGAENDIQLTTAWLLYNIWEVARDTRERMSLRATDGGQYGLEGLDEFGVAKRLASMRLAEYALRVGFQVFALPAGLFHYKLPDMDLVAKVADEYYSNDLRGGEGHMEVGKLIVNTVMQKAHITVSVKPFGCMPSSGVSDGVQSLIQARYPGTIYCAVETSGDGATNFYSRVQMYMFKARAAAEAELARAYEASGVTEQQVRDYLAKNPRFASPLHKPPHKVAGTAADLVYEVAPKITQSPLARAAKQASGAARWVAKAAAMAPKVASKALSLARDPAVHERVRADAAVLREVLDGKLKERFAPLVERLATRAVYDHEAPAASTTTMSAAPAVTVGFESAAVAMA